MSHFFIHSSCFSRRDVALPLFFQLSQSWHSWRSLFISVSLNLGLLSPFHLHCLLLNKTHAVDNYDIQVLLIWALALCNFILHCPRPALSSCRLWMAQAAAGWEMEISTLLLFFLSHKLRVVTQQLMPRQSKGLRMKIWKRLCCPDTVLPFCLFLTHTDCSHSLHSSPVNTIKLWPELETELNMCAPVLL